MQDLGTDLPRHETNWNDSLAIAEVNVEHEHCRALEPELDITCKRVLLISDYMYQTWELHQTLLTHKFHFDSETESGSAKE